MQYIQLQSQVVGDLLTPDSGKFNFFIGDDGLPKVKDSNGQTLTVDGSNVPLYQTTYNDFYTNIMAGGLIKGAYYEITDYKTYYDQPNFNTNGNVILTGNYKQSSTVEPIIVFALANNQISVDAYQVAYPKDKIKYDWTFNFTEVTNSLAKGRIIERIDEFNNRTDYDHRNILFKRYAGYAVDYSNKYPGVIDMVSTITGATITGTGTVFSSLSVGTVIYVGNNDREFRVTEITDNTNMVVTGNTYSDTYGAPYYGVYQFDLCYKQNNVDNPTGFTEYLTFDYNVNTYINNYIGNYGNLRNWDENYFYLPNNVFTGGSHINNTLGDYSYNNTFDDDCSDNVIGSYFYNNTCDDDFDNNVITTRFYNNYISANFQHNTTGYDFNGNVIINNNFYRNQIGNQFYSNRIAGDYDFQNNQVLHAYNNNTTTNSFIKNQIGIGFNTNDIQSNFEGNVIGAGFNNNNTYVNGSFEDNTIGNYFNDNTIKSYFTGNSVGNSFSNNTINYSGNTTNFYSNRILNDFENNTINVDFEENKIGGNSKGNLFGRDANDNGGVYSNTIGYGMVSNEILGNFSINIIGDFFMFNDIFGQFYANQIGIWFESNVTQTEFAYNVILNDFYNNEIGEYFGYGNNSDRGNVIGNRFQNNIISNHFYDNKISDNFTYNRTPMDFQYNEIKYPVDSVNFTTYNKQIIAITPTSTPTSIQDGNYYDLSAVSTLNGTGALFQVNISGGVVTDIIIQLGGFDYTLNETIIIPANAINADMGLELRLTDVSPEVMVVGDYNCTISKDRAAGLVISTIDNGVLYTQTNIDGQYD